MLDLMGRAQRSNLAYLSTGLRPVEGQRENNKRECREELQTQLQELVDMEVTRQALRLKGLLELGWFWDGFSPTDHADRLASKLRMFPARTGGSQPYYTHPIRSAEK